MSTTVANPFLDFVARAKTVNMLNLAIIDALNMMTPLEVIHTTEEVHQKGWRLAGPPPDRTIEFTKVVRNALVETVRSMYAAGKPQPEVYGREYLTPDVRLYFGGEDRDHRTLVVAFPGNGGRLMMPAPIILQHLPADRVDLMLVPDKLHANYRKGIPPLADTVADAMGPLGDLVPKGYRRVVAFGTSSGGVPSLIAAAALGCDHVLAVGAGHPDDERWAEGLKYTKRQMLVSAAPGLARCRITLAFGAQSPPDAVSAAAIRELLPHASIVPVSVPDIEVKHVALHRLVQARLLRAFLGDHLGLQQ